MAAPRIQLWHSLPSLTGRELRLMAFDGVEAISKLSWFRLTFRLIEPPDVCLIPLSYEFEAAKLIGTDISFGLPPCMETNNAEEPFHGVISSAEFGNDGSLVLEVEPRVALLKHSVGHRAFENQSVEAIIRDVVSAYGGIEIQFSKRAADCMVPVCIQHDERDFEFIARVLAGHGFLFYFTHRRGGHTMVVHDHSPALAVGPPRLLNMKSDNSENGCALDRWDRKQTVGPGVVTGVGFDPHRPAALLTGKADDSAAIGFERQLHHHLGSTSAPNSDRLREIVDQRFTALRAKRWLISAGGNCFLRPAQVVNRTGDRESFLVVSIRHSAHGGERFAGYAATWECIPAVHRYLPPVSDCRNGPKTFEAIVVDASGDVAGSVGRMIPAANVQPGVHVRLLGHAAEKNKNVIAVRVAGLEKGELDLPRVGQHVIVGMRGSDFDRPYLVGELPTKPGLPMPATGPLSRTTYAAPAIPDGGWSTATAIQVEHAAGKQQVLGQIPGEAHFQIVGSLAATVGKSMSVTAAENIQLNTQGMFAVNADGGVVIRAKSISLDTGEAFIVLKDGQISIQAKNTYIHGGGPSPDSVPEAIPVLKPKFQ